MLHKKWVIRQADKEAASAISEQFNIDPFLAFLLVSRGLTDDLAVQEFLHPGQALCAPEGFADMEVAAARLQQALDSGERICVYGDYDCDGVTATALLYSFLEAMGGNVIYYIPDRETEGYGLNKGAIDILAAKGTGLIVTVDNGISSVDEAEYIYRLGMQLVVTDHHQVGEQLPRAEAVVNPHRTDNQLPFTDFCGVGVAFKLACCLYDGEPAELLEQFGDLVAIGTVGDLVPLVGENRALVQAGLRTLQEEPRPGVYALLQAAGAGEELSGTDVAFKLCPRINAAGRMDSALRALELLLAEDEETAAARARQLCDDNALRQELERKIIDDITAKLAADPAPLRQRVLVVAGEDYHPGVIGIVASHLVERYGKPTVVLDMKADGTACGSARSIEGFDLYRAVSACSHVLTRFGGHPMAAGMGLAVADIPVFAQAINAYAEKEYPRMPALQLHLDCKLSPAYLTLDLAENLQLLEPCGTDNPAALFGLFHLQLVSVSPLGAEGKHLRLEAEKKGRRLRIVQFGVKPEDFPYVPGDFIDCAVQISKNPYKGKVYLSVRAADVRRSGTDDDRYFNELYDYRAFLQNGTHQYPVYPDRQVCAAVYRFLKSRGGWDFGTEELYFALQKGATYGQVLVALKALHQAGLIRRGKNQIRLAQPAGKVDLEATPILRKLREGASLGE